jgi:hypothetical protein
MVRVFNQVENTVVETKKMIKTISVEINRLDKILGHCGENNLKATTNAYGIKVFGKLEACESCAISKAKQTNTKKAYTGSINVPGERIYVDIILIKNESFGGAKFWSVIMENCTDSRWS